MATSQEQRLEQATLALENRTDEFAEIMTTDEGVPVPVSGYPDQKSLATRVSEQIDAIASDVAQDAQRAEDAADEAETARDVAVSTYADLQNSNDPAKGAAIVGHGVVAVDSIVDLLSIPESARREDLRYIVKGYHPPLNYLAIPYSGGGEFSIATGRHNGGTFIDPNREMPAGWNDQEDLAAWFNDSGVDVVGFKRRYEGAVDVNWFGCKGDGVSFETLPIAKALSVSGHVRFTELASYALNGTIVLPLIYHLEGNGCYFIPKTTSGLFLVNSRGFTSANVKKDYFRTTNYIKGFNFVGEKPGSVQTHIPEFCIKIGEEGELEPINVRIYNSGAARGSFGSVFRHTRGYGTTLRDCFVNTIVGDAVYIESSIGGGTDKYAFNIYLDGFDITGATNGVVLEGGKVKIQNSIIESCTGRAVWSRGIAFNPSVYMDNVYFENNGNDLYFDSEQSQGFTRNSNLMDCFFNSAPKIYLVGSTQLEVSNCKGFSFADATGTGTINLAYNPFNGGLNHSSARTIDLNLIGKMQEVYGSVAANTKKKVPFVVTKRPNTFAPYKSYRVVVSATRTDAAYFHGVYEFFSNATGAISKTIISEVSSGYPAPVFTTQVTDVSDFDLYLEFTSLISNLVVTVQ